MSEKIDRTFGCDNCGVEVKQRLPETWRYVTFAKPPPTWAPAPTLYCDLCVAAINSALDQRRKDVEEPKEKCGEESEPKSTRWLSAQSWHYRTGSGHIAMIKNEHWSKPFKVGDVVYIDGLKFEILGIESMGKDPTAFGFVVKGR